MRAIELLLVKAGDYLSARSWQLMERAVLTLQLIQGYGVRLRSTPDGTVISVDTAAMTWDNPFKVDLGSSSSCTITLGTVNNKVPEIEGVPMDGGKDAKKVTVPPFKWKETRLDDEGRGWITLTVELGDVWQVKRAYFEQVASLETDDGSPAVKSISNTALAVGGSPVLSGNRARFAIAMLRRSKNGQLESHQIAFHHLQHRVKVSANPKQRHRSFFYV